MWNLWIQRANCTIHPFLWVRVRTVWESVLQSNPPSEPQLSSLYNRDNNVTVGIMRGNNNCSIYSAPTTHKKLYQQLHMSFTYSLKKTASEKAWRTQGWARRVTEGGALHAEERAKVTAGLERRAEGAVDGEAERGWGGTVQGWVAPGRITPFTSSEMGSH